MNLEIRNEGNATEEFPSRLSVASKSGARNKIGDINGG
jgi:hypothetical protein